MLGLTSSDDKNYYEILEIEPDASPTDIREAYLRAKAAFKKDSVALYSLMSSDDTAQVLEQIEEAFRVLSNPDSRRNYDQGNGMLRIAPPSVTGTDFASKAETSSSKIVSIDRNPPMEADHEDDLLLAPKTDFSTEPTKPKTEKSGFIQRPTPEHTPFVHSPIPTSRGAADDVDANLRAEIDAELDWRGPFLRRIREARRVTLEEVSEYTKISRTYITAIEEEAFEKLPAPVFLRGFVTQLAKYLRLPSEKAAAAYLARYNDFKNAPPKAKSR